MGIVLTNIMFALALGSEPVVAPISPTVRCNIVLEDWCIASGPAQISMVDLAYRRLWIIRSSVGMEYGPLIIIADKKCNKIHAHRASFEGQSKKKISDNGEVYEAVFKLNGNACELKFVWPAGVASSYSYQEFMAFNVFVGKESGNGYTPLYEIYNKFRCHGVFIKKGMECR